MPTKSKQLKGGRGKQDQVVLNDDDDDILSTLFDLFQQSVIAPPPPPPLQQQKKKNDIKSSPANAPPRSNKRPPPPPQPLKKNDDIKSFDADAPQRSNKIRRRPTNKRPPPQQLDFDKIDGLYGLYSPTDLDELSTLFNIHQTQNSLHKDTKGTVASSTNLLPQSVQRTTKRRKELQEEEEHIKAIFKKIMINQQHHQKRPVFFIITSGTKQKLKRNYEILCEKYESSTPYVIIIAEDPSTSYKTGYLVYHPDTDIDTILKTFETKHKPLRIHSFIWKDENGDVAEFTNKK